MLLPQLYCKANKDILLVGCINMKTSAQSMQIQSGYDFVSFAPVLLAVERHVKRREHYQKQATPMLCSAAHHSNTLHDRAYQQVLVLVHACYQNSQGAAGRRGPGGGEGSSAPCASKSGSPSAATPGSSSSSRPSRLWRSLSSGEPLT